MSIRSCDYCEGRLRAFLDAELGRDETARVRAHLVDCARCRAALAAHAAVSRLVAALPADLEPPPHFSANLQLRLSHLRPGAARRPWGRPRWRRRYPLAVATIAGALVALVFSSPPRLGAQDLVGKVQESWQRLQSYSCRFVTDGLVRGKPRRFEQRQWFAKPDLFRLETNQHYPETVYLEADRVTTFIPGARWRGRRVAITRPRRAREEGLPFPFGREWPASVDITMDALVRELCAQEGGEMLGTEPVLGKQCYVLKFHTQRRSERRPTYYQVWVDQESFLPLKAKIYHDSANQTISTAVDLQTNILLPSETFHFEPAPDTFHVFGEAEPFVFALGLAAARTAAFDTNPLGAARVEMRQRAAKLPFAPLAPGYLPPGYVLVRVRAAAGRWLDAYWINNHTGDLLKIVEQSSPLALPLETDPSTVIALPAPPHTHFHWREVLRPVRSQYLTWDLGGTRLSLAAAGLRRGEALRCAASFAPITVGGDIARRGREGAAGSALASSSRAERG